MRGATYPVTILGRAGGALGADASWAKSQGHARAGQRAELATGAVLDDWARTHPGVAVLHDLDVPRSGYSANVDHAVISGRDVLLVDSKAWAPGFVWSLGPRGFRGLQPFDAATKRTLPMAAAAYAELLEDRGVRGAGITSMLAVWCSRSQGRVTTWALNPPDARAVPGPSLAARPGRWLPRRPADPAIVSALTPLVRT